MRKPNSDDYIITEYKCPKCGSENIQSFQLLRDVQTSGLDAITAGSGTAGAGIAITSGIIQTNLARKIELPPRPWGVWGMCVLAIFIFVGVVPIAYIVAGILGFLGILLGFYGAGPDNWKNNVNIMPLFWFAVIPIWMLSIKYMIRKVKEYDNIIVPQKIKEFQEKHICLRCGFVFRIRQQ